MHLKSFRKYLGDLLGPKNVKSIRINLYYTECVFGYKSKPKGHFEVPHEVLISRSNESNFYRLVSAYRQHAHQIADIDPVDFRSTTSRMLPELDPRRYGLKNNDIVNFTNIIHSSKGKGTVEEAVKFLNEVYCGHISAEFSHLEVEEEREWFCERYEEISHENATSEAKVSLAKKLLKSEVFDNFMAKKFPTVKRYGGEGAESMMAFFSEFFRLSAYDNLDTVVLAMPHRGRLNLLTGMLNVPPAKLFRKLRGFPDFPIEYQCTGDVLSHAISSTDLNIDERKLHVTVLYNPSHLEIVNPVSMGKTRAKQMEHGDGDYSISETSRWSDKILNLQVHGDAALAGQGVNYEMLNFSIVPNFEIGGTIHLVVNNQLGFTTPSYIGRSSRYCTDIAKLIPVPVLHVNGDDPEAVLKATRIAFEYQRKFRKDVFVDLNCYRRWGHNELDDPTFTNPAIYKKIHSRRTVPQRYVDKLIREELITQQEVDAIRKQDEDWLNSHLAAAETYRPQDPCFQKQWQGFQQAENKVTIWDTGVDFNLLTFIGEKSVSYPENFVVHPHLLKTHVNVRLSKISNSSGIDWSTAEALAIGSLLYEGYNVRISGQDVGRATFSHRHAMLVDQETSDIYIPLNHIHPNQKGFLEIANSTLSEEAVLAYEYGMSIESPRNLVIWEAQFGDFSNGAQVVIDTYISGGEIKWLWSSGLVLLLPHGYDGAGPEHSSCRIERFLQLTNSSEDLMDGDNINMQVCQPSTPAQYFHLLRRQMIRNYRKPLIVVMPKSLLRLTESTSSLTEMTKSSTFLPVIGDATVNPSRVGKIILTSGKHYYTLLQERKAKQINNTAIIRIESFCPFPAMELQQELEKYSSAKMILWCQEEPENMGAWSFLKPRFENIFGRKVRYVGRKPAATPASGVGKWHQEEVENIRKEPFQLSG